MDAPAPPRTDAGGAPTPDAFRRAMGQVPTGVTIITATVAGRLVGMTANSLASVSLEPPLVLWSVARRAASHDAFVAAEGFAVHVLGAAHAELARRFASRARDRFAGLAHAPGLFGAPVIVGPTPVLECRTEARHEGGDHTILVGRVRRLREAPEGAEPLLFHRGALRPLGAPAA